MREKCWRNVSHDAASEHEAHGSTDSSRCGSRGAQASSARLFLDLREAAAADQPPAATAPPPTLQARPPPAAPERANHCLD